MNHFPLSLPNLEEMNYIPCPGSLAFEKSGFLILRNFLPAETVDNLKVEITSLESRSTLYFDQLGKPRRLEQFVKDSSLMLHISSEINKYSSSFSPFISIFLRIRLIISPW